MQCTVIQYKQIGDKWYPVQTIGPFAERQMANDWAKRFIVEAGYKFEVVENRSPIAAAKKAEVCDEFRVVAINDYDLEGSMIPAGTELIATINPAGRLMPSQVKAGCYYVVWNLAWRPVNADKFSVIQ